MIFLNTQILLKPCKISKTIGKIMQTKILLKFKLWDIIFVVIFFYKIIFSSDSYTLIINLKNDDENIFLILKVYQGPRVTYP